MRKYFSVHKKKSVHVHLYSWVRHKVMIYIKGPWVSSAILLGGVHIGARPLLDLNFIWRLYRSPIVVERRGVFYSFKWFLPALAAVRGGGQHPVDAAQVGSAHTNFSCKYCPFLLCSRKISYSSHKMGSQRKWQKNIQHQVPHQHIMFRTAPEASPFSLVTTFKFK